MAAVAILKIRKIATSPQWNDQFRRRATVAACDSSDTWQCKTGGVRRLAVANGPNIFQMLLVF